MGGKFYVSIHVSFANACVSKDYANGERFGFGSLWSTIFVVYASPRDWLFCFHPHDLSSKTASASPFPLSDTAPKPRNRYLSQLFGNGVVSTTIFDTGHNTLIINTVISARSTHCATRANGVGRESRTRDL